VKAPYEVNWLPNPDRQLKDLPNHGMAGDKYFSVAGHGSEFAEYQHRILAIDPSGRGADETSYAVGFMLAGNIWVPCAGGFSGGYETETLKKLAVIAKKHKIQTIVVESNFGDGMYESLLKPVLAKEKVTAEVVGVRHHTMKEQRILDVLEPVVSAHKLIVDPEVISSDDASVQRYEAAIRTHKSLFHQMTHICREKGALRHDDRVDALAMMVAHFVELMAQDAEKTAANQYEERVRKELENFHGEIIQWGGDDTHQMSWNKVV